MRQRPAGVAGCAAGKDSKRAATLARVVLLMAVIILGWAAYVLHPAMLVR